MKLTTLCFLLKDDEVLLAMKKRGFGAGKWNGVGGKVNEAAGETVEAAAIREVREEIGIVVAQEDLRSAGTVSFRYQDNPGWDTLCHIFTVVRWEGEPGESEEMRPAWYRQDNLPFAEMWADDPHWLPLVLVGGKIRGDFIFDAAGKTILSFDMHFDKGFVL